jgi:threonine dehydrogenase-like Zn-dependent dehydrogenase
VKALALDYQQRILGLRDVPEPEALRQDEVCFRVHEVGICGTDRDLSRFKFGYPPAPDSFLILGHEAVGEVVATGSGVTGLRKGDWVVPTVRRGCSHCPPCLRNRSDLCVTGGYVERGIMGAHGYLCDYVVERESNLVPIPDRLREVAVLAEPLSVVEKAVGRALELRQEPAANALVLGAGPIGILCSMLLGVRGIEVTLQSKEETGSSRARLVEDAGARYVQEAESRFDIVIEAAGAASAAYAGIRKLGPLGVCVLLGAQSGTEVLNFRDLILGNQIVVGSVNSSPDNFARAVADLSSFHHALLNRMISRCSIDLYRSSFSNPGADLVKQVHVLH